jgi:hypothetical protein
MANHIWPERASDWGFREAIHTPYIDSLNIDRWHNYSTVWNPSKPLNCRASPWSPAFFSGNWSDLMVVWVRVAER